METKTEQTKAAAAKETKAAAAEVKTEGAPAGKSGREAGRVRLSRPININGKVVKELFVDVKNPPPGFDWGTLHQLELEYPAVFPDYPVPNVFIGDAKYRAMIIARLNGLHYDDLKGISPFDGLTLDNELGRFLMTEPSGTSEEES
jgi:hypothetical protein